ncbi:hypothetical protein FRX31_030699 [Thalictrum thalictroides]|uniref:Uncharacterized protein n=1 Tax=Thalictrum thalictroides TaxID=46969 RepID=A0A7J6V3S8_THATH|nr:hypothetical protein FRX31_030699 [Thalictrum thalictroides]
MVLITRFDHRYVVVKGRTVKWFKTFGGGGGREGEKGLGVVTCESKLEVRKFRVEKMVMVMLVLRNSGSAEMDRRSKKLKKMFKFLANWVEKMMISFLS